MRGRKGRLFSAEDLKRLDARCFNISNTLKPVVRGD